MRSAHTIAEPDPAVVVSDTRAVNKPAEPVSHRERAGAAIETCSGWMLVAALVYAPWAFGSTRPETIASLERGLALMAVLWVSSLVIRKKWPRIHPIQLGAAAVLFLTGGWMTWNAHYHYLPEPFGFVSRAEVWRSWPGALDYSTSLATCVRLWLMLLACGLATHLALQNAWRKRLLWCVALTGTSIVAFGLAQRFAGAPSIFWQARDTGSTFFATYRYHSNAGAFINLIWPFLAAFLALSIRRRRPWFIRLAWAAAVLLSFSALAISGARAASLVALVLAGAWALWACRQIRAGHLPQPEPANAVVSALLLIALLGVVAATAGLDVSARRWDKVDELFTTQNERLLVYGVCVDMIATAPWTGMGPGSFQIAFPYFTHDLGDAVAGIWKYAHQDYLQMLIEWGVTGSLAWAVFVGGAFWVAVRSHVTRSPAFRDRPFFFAIITAACGVMLHALVDFPLQIASIQLYFAVLVGLLWAWPKSQSSR